MKAYLQSGMVMLATMSLAAHAEPAPDIIDAEIQAMGQEAMMQIEQGIARQLPGDIARQYQQIKDRLQPECPARETVKQIPDLNNDANSIKEARS